MAESLTVQLQNILDEYSEEVKQAANDSIDKVAKQSAQKIRAGSPRRTGKYARGWRVRREGGPGGIVTAIVHNSTNYQLTHLLERGHVIRNKKGTYGRVPGRPHIAPVEAWANNELPLEIERKLK